MVDLPSKIMVWESSPDLHHTGTWATTRYPAEAVTYVPKADLAAAQAQIEALRGALTRQGDNMAFVLNHMTMPDGYYEKFIRELEQDRAALPAKEGE